jgi:hypothetical protein
MAVAWPFCLISPLSPVACLAGETPRVAKKGRWGSAWPGSHPSLEAQGRSSAFRFRTIQVCPKDQSINL